MHQKHETFSYFFIYKPNDPEPNFKFLITLDSKFRKFMLVII